MTLHLVSISRPDNKIYRTYPVPSPGGVALYEVVETEAGRVDRVMCKFLLRRDALMIVKALNSMGSEISE